jgi:glutathione S-transferase
MNTNNAGEKLPARLLANGGIHTVERYRHEPVLHWFPGSFNSGKATLAMQLSQKGKLCQLNYVLHLRDNYVPEYVRLNPDTMAVPTLEIDDKVCTDSLDACMYLMEHYPSPGDQQVIEAGRKQEMLDWIHFVNCWDEYQYTYGHLSADQAIMPNEIRLINLRINLKQVLDDKPADVDSLVDAYVRKIANVSNMKRVMEEGEEKQKDVEDNLVVLQKVLFRANELAGKNPGGYLFGDKLTTGDVYFLPILRIFKVLSGGLELKDELWLRNPNLKAYWERAKLHPDVKVGLLDCVEPLSMCGAMLRNGVPLLILSYKLGFLKAPTIPTDIEKRIAAETEAAWETVRGSK